MLRGEGKQLHVKLLVGFKAAEQWQVKFCGHWLAKTGEAFKELKEDPTYLSYPILPTLPNLPKYRRLDGVSGDFHWLWAVFVRLSSGFGGVFVGSGCL